MTVHNIPPVYDADSRILILGSFPSVKSRESGFFYGHAQNRFWKVLAMTFCLEVPRTIEEKKKLLHDCRIALWDVIGQCEIDGSSDASIREAIPNDISVITDCAKIEKIIVNGKTAEKYYLKYLSGKVSVPYVSLPSTSPANAAYSLDRLYEAWSAELLHLHKCVKKLYPYSK